MVDTVDLSQKRILLVEDEPLVGDLIKVALSKQQIRVDVVKDGLLVIPTLQQDAYDLILLDLGLPGKDGMSILTEMRQLPNYQFTPVIILTNYGDLERIRQARNLGANGYLIKSSIDYTHIRETLSRELGIPIE